MNKTLIEYLKAKYPDVTIVMASKYLEADAFQPFIDAGIRDFGESRVEAFLEKLETFRHLGITKHFLGPVQSKKIKKIADDVDVLHSLDRVKIAREFDKRRTRPLPCFIQINISGEPQKHGLKPEALPDFLENIRDLKFIEPIGLMGMAALTEDETVLNRQFALLNSLREKHRKDHPMLNNLSMGMSNDYEIALKHGASHLRLGRILLKEESHG